MKACPLIVRPWLKAGLSTLLMENEARVLELRADAGAVQSGTQTAPSSSDPLAFVPPSRPSVPRPFRPAPVQDVAPERRQAAPPVSAAQAQSRPASPAQPRPSAQTLLATPGALPPERWPAAWQALKNRRPLPSRPLVLWTYAGLGDDLTAAPDEARRRVVVRMLTELKHPAGTHVFWPFALTGEASSPEASLFWSGVKMLDPRVLLLFGSDTRDALDMPKTLKPFGQLRLHGRLIIQLPRPQALAEDEAAFRQVQAFLARMLRFCCSR